MSEWPEHSAELARKSIDVLERVVSDHFACGKPTRHEVKLIAHAVYDTVIGLVPMPIADTILVIARGAAE